MPQARIHIIFINLSWITIRNKEVIHMLWIILGFLVGILFITILILWLIGERWRLLCKTT